jgi:hypothetical protein
VFLQGLGYSIQEAVFDPEQNVNLTMAIHEQMPDVEIIWSEGSAGPLDRMLNKHPKGIVYHVCYVSKDVHASVRAFDAAGLEPVCVFEPKPAVLFGGKPVVFYSIKGIGLIEIIAE